MGTMVTRYMIVDADGLSLTHDETWSDETDDAIQFRHEDEACEAASLYPGATVERFQRWSRFPDFVSITEAAEVAA